MSLSQAHETKQYRLQVLNIDILQTGYIEKSASYKFKKIKRKI